MTDNFQRRQPDPQDAGSRPVGSPPPVEIDQLSTSDSIYDALGDPAQERVRGEWQVGVARSLAEMNLDVEFEAAGEAWAEADGEGGSFSAGHARWDSRH